MVTTSPDKSLIPPAGRPAPLTGLSRVVTCLFVLLTLIPQFTFAAPTSSEVQKVQNPTVVFTKGLLTVEAKDVKLKALMEAISQKAGVGVSVSTGLKREQGG